MLKLVLLLSINFLFSQSNNLFISEYAETRSSNNRYLEIYNNTGLDINLSEYFILLTKNNGSTYEINLNDNSDDSNNSSGFLGHEEVLIIIKSDSGYLLNEENLNYPTNDIQFIEWSNLTSMAGDDAVELFHNDELIDVIGTPGIDPGSAWDVGDIPDGTKDHTLVRSHSIIDGTNVWSEIEGSECIGENAGCNQWLVYDADVFDFGGYHSFDSVGCTDIDACNYNDEAENDDGTCYYETELYDCDGVCIEAVDCNNECGGSAVEDECGICDGNNWSCADCNGDPNGQAYLNECDTCVEGNTGLSLDDCVGCLDMDGCNYNANANIEGECNYPNECGVCNAAYTHCESENVTFLDQWSSGQENPFAVYGLHTYNDVWGYTDNNGNEFALIGAWDGTHIIDITNSPIEEVAFIPGSFSTHRDIKTFGNYMYIGTEANVPDPAFYNQAQPQGIQIVNLADPYNPILINEWDVITQSHNIMEYNGYLYIIGSVYEDVNDDGNISDIIVLDLSSNPENPIYVSEWSGHYIHDVCMHGNRLYGCGITDGSSYDDKMFAFDISDPSNINLIGQWDGVYAAHACWVSDDGNTVFTGSEFGGGHIMSFDVSDINNINLLDNWMPDGGETWSAHNLFRKDNYLYISYYVYGLQILDISDPLNMVGAGYYDTLDEIEEGLGSNDIFSGVWGVYPFFDSNKTIISDMENGLFVLKPSLLSGDINADGEVNVVDVVTLVNMIFDDYQADSDNDLNNDGSINIFDIIILIDIILN